MTAPIWALLCSAALTLVRLGSASSDDSFVEQREVSFTIPPELRQEIMPPDSFFLQRPLDLSELLDRFKEQPNIQFSPRASRPHDVPPLEYNVQFPLALPTSQNIMSICLHGDRRPRYPSSYFPSSGYGVNKREADAVNTLEAWFGMCCGQHQTEEARLCCATQAWKKSISRFCEIGFRIKAPHFHCCKLKGSERLSCFNHSSPNPEYNPTEDSPVQPLPSKVKFTFDPSSCPGTSMTPQTIRDGKKGEKMKKKPATILNMDWKFPLAAPTDSNIESLCHNHNLRPLYDTKCLKGLNRVALQAKSTNALEKDFKICCKSKDRKNVLPCAQKSWQENMKKFCDASKLKRIDFLCCDGGVQFECFKNMSTDHGYNNSLGENISLNNVCDTHKIIMKKFLVGAPLKNMVSKCCHLTPTERSACIPQSVGELFEATCSSRRSPPSVKRCCRLSSAECFNKVLMDAITKATSRQKKKICPVRYWTGA